MQVTEEFSIQQLIAQLVMEALDVRLFPRRAWLDVERFNLSEVKPVLQRIGDELRAIVAADMLRRSVPLNRLANHRNHIDRSDRTPNMRCVTFTREFVDQC